MIDISPLAMATTVALVVLTGSLIGSTLIFLGGSKPQSEPPANGHQRPADWPTRSGGVTRYSTVTPEQPRNRMPLLGMLVVGGVAYLLAAVGMTVYQSPWEPETTLRHMAASLHCDLAKKVDLVPSRLGEPGYHVRNDGDGNGIACETYAVGVGLPAGVATEVSTLSTPQPVQPAAGDTEALAVTQ